MHRLLQIIVQGDLCPDELNIFCPADSAFMSANGPWNLVVTLELEIRNLRVIGNVVALINDS